MKINKKQWPVISSGIDRIVNLINLAGEQIRAIAILLRVMSNHEFELERKKASCSICIYYCSPSETGSLLGECRINPPIKDAVLNEAGETYIQSGFPTVQPDKWCGRWRPQR